MRAVKRAIIESAREVCGSVRVGGKNPKNMWWKDEVNVAVKRRENAWKQVMGARDEGAKEKMYGSV